MDFWVLLVEINPMVKVPVIVDGRFKLFERYVLNIFVDIAISQEQGIKILLVNTTIFLRFMLELVYWYVYYVNFNIVHWLHFLLAVMLFLSTFLVRFLVWQITGKWLLISVLMLSLLIQIDFGKNSSGYSFPKLVSIKGRRVDLISVGIWFNNCFLALNYDLILWVQMNSVNLSCVYI